MSSFVDPEVDKVFNIYRQYARISDPQTAGYLTLAHFIDHIVCVMKTVTDPPPEVIRYDSSKSE